MTAVSQILRQIDAPAYQPHLSRIAADAIVAQVSRLADCEGTFRGDVDGTEVEFTAWFSTDYAGPYRDEVGPCYYEAECALLGAYGENPDTGAMIAGGKAELARLVGERTVYGWEQQQAEVEMGQ